MTNNSNIEKAILNFYNEKTDEKYIDVLKEICAGMFNNCQFIIPIHLPQEAMDMFNTEKINSGDEEELNNDFQFKLLKLTLDNGSDYIAAFTNEGETSNGPSTSTISYTIKDFFEGVKDLEDVEGVIINPWGNKFILSKNLVDVVLKGEKIKN